MNEEKPESFSPSCSWADNSFMGIHSTYLMYWFKLDIYVYYQKKNKFNSCHLSPFNTYHWYWDSAQSSTAYLDVGAEFGVNPVGSQHVRQRGGAREGGGDGVAHFREGEHLEAELLVHLLQLFVRLLFSLTQDAAHGIPTLLWWPLRGHRNSIRAFRSH